MSIGDRTTITGIVLSAVIALGTVAMPPEFWSANEWLRSVVLVVCAVVGVGCIGYLCYLHVDWRGKKMYPILLMALGAIVFFTGAIWLGEINERRSNNRARDKDTSTPDVSAKIRLIYPKNPSLVLINNSEKILRQIKWSAAIWNMDDPRTYVNTNPPPNAHDPLPIPVSTFDFLRPNTISGPQKLIDERYVKNGERLVGSVSAICPECSRGRTYVLSVIWGEGGWYAELPDIKEGEIVIPPHLTKDEIVAYAAEIERRIPQADRIVIK